MKTLTHTIAEPLLTFYDQELKGGKVRPSVEMVSKDEIIFYWGGEGLICVQGYFGYNEDKLEIEQIEEIYYLSYFDNQEYSLPEIIQSTLKKFFLDWFPVDKEVRESAGKTPPNYGY